MNDSILEGIRRGCQVDQECDDFDLDLIPIANSIFSKLTRLGVGCSFEVRDTTQVWGDYIQDTDLLGFVKQYVQKKVRLSFDPPSSSSVAEAFKKEADELEWNIIEYLESKE